MAKYCAQIVAMIATSIFCLPASAQAFEEYSGQMTFQRFCASCHGEEGKGDGPVAQGIPISVPDLTTMQRRHGDEFPAEALRRIIDGRNAVIFHGTRYMPVWGYEFWVEEGADEAAEKNVEIIIANLIDYIISIQE
jgi:mono/diheme cytochrome c family protein